MSRRRDSVARLRAINPIQEHAVEGPDSPRAEALLAGIIATRPEADTRRQPGGRRLRLAIAIASVAVLTIAAAWVWTRIITTPNAVSCYQAADLEATVAAAPSGGSATADACAPVWEDEILTNPDITPEGSIPPLTACVADNGSLAVFPTDDTTICDQLGLAYPDPQGQDQADLLREVQDRLITYFQSADCIPVDTAEADIRRLLDQAGLTSWTIQTQPSTSQRPCASHSYQPNTQTITLIPIPAG